MKIATTQRALLVAIPINLPLCAALSTGCTEGPVTDARKLRRIPPPPICPDPRGPLVQDGPPITLSGRVVTPEGAPLEAARVSLIGPHYPDSAAQGMGTVDTDIEGRFAFPPKPASAIHHLVVRTDDSEHTYMLPYVPTRDLTPERDVGVLHIGADRELALIIECAGPLFREPPDNRISHVFARFTWREHPLVYGIVWPHDLDRSRLALWGYQDSPGYTQSPAAYLRDESARRFERAFRLPAGRHVLEISGACGDRILNVDVPDSGTVAPLRLSFGSAPNRDQESIEANRRMNEALSAPCGEEGGLGCVEPPEADTPQ